MNTLQVKKYKASDFENSQLAEPLSPRDGLMSLIVDHVGRNKDLRDSVTVVDVIESLSEEFPEIVFVLAEENFIRGYEQAVCDLTGSRRDQ